MYDPNTVIFSLGKTVLIPRKNFNFTIVMDCGFFMITEPAISLHVFAYDEESLIHEFAHTIKFLWRCYALENDNRLVLDALKVKQCLLSSFEEVAVITEP